MAARNRQCTVKVPVEFRLDVKEKIKTYLNENNVYFQLTEALSPNMTILIYSICVDDDIRDKFINFLQTLDKKGACE